jgi:5-methyltetrahydrofolate--homocysteine methyltransferase
MGPTGELFAPMGELTHESTVAFFTEQAEALAEGGADALWIETMSSTEEVAAAAEAAKKTGFARCGNADLRYGSSLHDGRHSH